MKNIAFKASLFTATLTTGLLLAGGRADASNFLGNGNGNFGGPVGQGYLTVTDDGNNITVTLTRGPGSLNDSVAIYVDTGAPGYTNTSTFTDTSGQEQRAISGYGNGSRSLLTFASGFTPSYAIAIKGDYMDVWNLANPASLQYLTGATQGGNSSATFSLTFSCSTIGLTPNTPHTIRLFGTLLSAGNPSYRSTEAVAGNDTSDGDGPGSLPFFQVGYGTYVFASPAAPPNPVTFLVDMSVPIANGSLLPLNGDQVFVTGSFLTNMTLPLLLAPSANNTNIYTGSYPVYDPTNIGEVFNVGYISGTTTNQEAVDPRPFTVASPGVTNTLFYYDDVYPNPSASTRQLTFAVNMNPQYLLGHFNPAGGDTIQVEGTFESPKWTQGFTLVQSNNTYVYTNTTSDGNYTGTFENYKFVIVNGANSTYEYLFNRDFFTPSGSQTFPGAFFNNISNVYATTVSFQVDMSAQVATGNFNPANGDTVCAAGTFQTNQWTINAFLLTNNPTAANSNIYTGTYTDKNAPGTSEQYKFVVVTSASSTNYESMANNRTFNVASSSPQALPLVFFSNLDPNNILLAPTTVMFTINMSNAVDEFGNPFNPASDVVMVDGDFLTPNWALLSDPTDLYPNQDFPNQVLQNTPLGSSLYTASFNIPAGNSLQVTYKYGIYHNTGSPNTNDDNEAPINYNHVRFIRSTGTYNFPTDYFGQQVSDPPATIEPSFGNLAIGTPSGGTFPITWLGRPGVNLQYTTNLVNPTWINLPATTGLQSTNWNMSAGPAYFRLVNP